MTLSREFVKWSQRGTPNFLLDGNGETHLFHGKDVGSIIQLNQLFTNGGPSQKLEKSNLQYVIIRNGIEQKQAAKPKSCQKLKESYLQYLFN